MTYVRTGRLLAAAHARPRGWTPARTSICMTLFSEKSRNSIRCMKILISPLGYTFRRRLQSEKSGASVLSAAIGPVPHDGSACMCQVRSDLVLPATLVLQGLGPLRARLLLPALRGHMDRPEVKGLVSGFGNPFLGFGIWVPGRCPFRVPVRKPRHPAS